MSRKVIEDDVDRQLVEQEEAASWTFLWFSRTLNVCCSGSEPTSTLSKPMIKHFFQLIEYTCPSMDVL